MIESYLASVSTYSHEIDNLILMIGGMVGFWFVLSFGIFIYLILRFRAKDGVKAEYITGTESHQKRWVSYPHYAVLVFDVFIIIGAVQVWHNVKIALPPAEETVRVIGQQWAWSFVQPGPDGVLDTPDDIATVDELRIKKGTLYHFKLESRDVMHSFSIPSFRLKQDAVPGRIITGWFEATSTGEYDIQCAEICGLGHGVMGAKVIIETPSEHKAWMARANTAASPISVAAVSVP